MTWKYNTTSEHAKLLNLEDLPLLTDNEDLDMVQTNITVNISKASHAKGEYSFI